MAKGGRSSFASWARWTVATAVVSLLQVPHCEGVSARSSVYFDSEVPFTGHGDVTRLLSLLDLTLPGLEAVARHAESDPQTAADELLKYYRKRCKEWRITSHIFSFLKSVDVADDALQGKLYHLGGQVKARQVAFESGQIEWDNLFWESDHDGEWGWALHRQPFWMNLAWSYQQTKEEKYAEGFTKQLLDWIRKNPRDPRFEYDWGKVFRLQDGKMVFPKSKRGWNTNPVHPHLTWAWRRVDAGRRALNLPEQMAIFIDSPSFTTEVLVNLLNSAHEHGEFIAATPYRGFTKDNHGLFEAEGSAALGIFFTEFLDAAEWRRASFAVLEREIEAQIYPDGYHIEAVFGYHTSVIRLLTEPPLIAKDNGIEAVDDSYWVKVELMCLAILAMGFPNGDAPHFGDHITPATSTYFGLLRTWAKRLGIPQMLFAARATDDVALMPKATAFTLPWAGLYSMRTSWDRDATMLVLRCGPSYNGHSHKDAGTFELFSGDAVLLPDSGCYTYSGVREQHPANVDRQFFSSTKAHNVMTLNDMDAHTPSLHSKAMLPNGYDDCGLLAWETSPSVQPQTGTEAILVIENRLTYRKPNLSHRRHVIFLPEITVVVDEAIGDATGSVSTHFHLLPGPVEVDHAASEAATARREGKNILVKAFGNRAQTTLTNHTGYVSAAVGKKTARPSLNFTQAKVSEEPLRFVTALVPFDSGSDRPVVDVTFVADPPSATGVAFAEVKVSVNGKTTSASYLYDADAMTMTPPRGYAHLKKEKRKAKAEELYFRYYDAFLESPPDLPGRDRL